MTGEESFEDFLRRVRLLRGRHAGDTEPRQRQRLLAHNVWQMHCAVLGWKANRVDRASTYKTLDGNLQVSVTMGDTAAELLGLKSYSHEVRPPTSWLQVGDLTEGKRINFWHRAPEEPGVFSVDNEYVAWIPDKAAPVSLNVARLNALLEVPSDLAWQAIDFANELETIISVGGRRFDVLGYSCPDIGVVQSLQQMWPTRENVPTHVADIETDRLTLYVGVLGDEDWFGRCDVDPDFSEMPDSADYPAWIPIDLWRNV